MGRLDFRAPNQGLESSFCGWIAGQRLAQKECLFRHRRYSPSISAAWRRPRRGGLQGDAGQDEELGQDEPAVPQPRVVPTLLGQHPGGCHFAVPPKGESERRGTSSNKKHSAE